MVEYIYWHDSYQLDLWCRAAVIRVVTICCLFITRHLMATRHHTEFTATLKWHLSTMGTKRVAIVVCVLFHSTEDTPVICHPFWPKPISSCSFFSASDSRLICTSRKIHWCIQKGKGAVSSDVWNDYTVSKRILVMGQNNLGLQYQRPLYGVFFLENPLLDLLQNYVPFLSFFVNLLHAIFSLPLTVLSGYVKLLEKEKVEHSVAS